MSDLTLVGDELRLDGETVAVLVPGLAQDAVGPLRRAGPELARRPFRWL